MQVLADRDRVRSVVTEAWSCKFAVAVFCVDTPVHAGFLASRFDSVNNNNILHCSIDTETSFRYMGIEQVWG